VLFGGLGNDTLYGGADADSFHFGRLEGSGTIADFNTAEDKIVLDDGVSVTRTRVQDVNRDGVKDLTLTLSWGSSVTLLGVGDATQVQFGAPDYYSDHQPGLGGFLDDIGDIFDSLYAGHQKLIDTGWF
jgi:Ca2+-binding RTX toxin-like protein